MYYSCSLLALHYFLNLFLSSTDKNLFASRAVTVDAIFDYHCKVGWCLWINRQESGVLFHTEAA